MRGSRFINLLGGPGKSIPGVLRAGIAGTINLATNIRQTNLIGGAISGVINVATDISLSAGVQIGAAISGTAALASGLIQTNLAGAAMSGSVSVAGDILSTPAFQGAGDIKPGAFAWWGLRAYSAAYAASQGPAIDLVDQAGANSITVNVKTDGTLDTASIATWMAAHSVTAPKVAKWYDQAGSGFHLTQASLANMPDYVAQWPGVGGGKPCLQMTQANSQAMTSAATGLNTATGTFSTVSERTAFNNFSGLFQAGTSGIMYNGSNDQGALFMGNDVVSFPMSDNSPHTCQWVYNGANCRAIIDGGNTANTYNLTSSETNFTSPFTLGKVNNSFPISGRVSEVGFWNSVFSVADCQAIDSNQNSYWWSGSTYEGFVASRARTAALNGTDDGTNKFMMSRSAHFATENLTAVRLLFSQIQGMPITASIEFPSGTFTQVKFSKSANGTVGGNFYLFSDYATVSIPSGAQFWVRTFVGSSSGAGVRYLTIQNSFLGEATALSTASISDQTMGGTITNSGSFSAPPMAILGYTSNPSFLLMGDSIVAGIGDTEDSSASITGFNGKIGEFARSLGNVPFVNLGVGGATAAQNANFQQLWAKGSHVLCNFGTNDLFQNSNSVSQLDASLAEIFHHTRAHQRVYQATILPRTTSTDGFVTLANQTTVSSGGEANRETFNAALRAGASGLAINGAIDVTTVLESSLNSGKWIVTPTPPYTGDGTHPNAAGYALIQAANLIAAPSWP